MKIHVAYFVYHEYFLKIILHQTCAVRCTVFWTKNIPSAPYVCTVCPWEATTDTMEITGIPPHTTLVAQIEIIKCIIEYFKLSFTRDMKGLLKDTINARDIGGPVFVQKHLILSKLDEIITHNKVTTNQSTGEREEWVLHLVEEGVSSEDDIMTVLR